jgi:translation initiation factor 2 beta subunit (eIF-2beta)/eIF-5
MPTNVVKTPEDERLWQKAKARAKEQGKPDNYAYIMGIYKQMNSERFKSAQRVATRYAAASPDMDALSRAIDDLSDGLADVMDHHALQWRDTPGLAKANSNIMHALSAYQDELEKFYSQEHARLEKEREQERLEQERLERERQEKERQEKERRDIGNKLERLAAKVFKDWNRDTSGVGGEWLLASYWDTEGKTAYETAEQAVESFINQARKLVGGAPSFRSREEKPNEGTIKGALKNSRMFDIQISGQAYLDIDGSSMADLTVAVGPKE